MSEREKSVNHSKTKPSGPDVPLPSWIQKMDTWRSTYTPKEPSVVFTADIVDSNRTPRRMYDPDRERED